MSTYSLSPEAACAPVEDGAVLLHMGTRRYYSLNETGAAIWRMLEEDVAITDIPARLADFYAADANVVAASLDRLLGELAAENLIAFPEDT